MEQKLRLGNGAFSRWKYGKNTSYMNYLADIASFLNVTPEHLLETSEKKVETENLTLEETEIIRIYRSIGSEERFYVMKMLKMIHDSIELRKIKQENELYSKKYNEIENETSKPCVTESEEDENHFL